MYYRYEKKASCPRFKWSLLLSPSAWSLLGRKAVFADRCRKQHNLNNPYVFQLYHKGEGLSVSHNAGGILPG